jgi:hypothetical protein
LGFFDDLGGAIFGDDDQPGVFGAVYQLGDTAVNNLIDAGEQAVVDIWNTMWDIPEMIGDALMQMFRDPKFWQALLIFFGLIGIASGFSAALDAPAGEKMLAFRTGAGLAYGKLHVGFLTKVHKLAFTVSPEYRQQVAVMLEGFSDNLYEQGVDLQYASQLIMTTGALVNSLYAFTGSDMEEFDQHWSQVIGEMGTVTGETMQQWGEDPNAMMDWLDAHVIKPAYDNASEVMQNVQSGLDTALTGLDEVVGNIGNFSDAYVEFAESADDLLDTDYAQQVKEDVTRWIDPVIDLYESNRGVIVDIRDALTERIATAEELAVMNTINNSRITAHSTPGLNKQGIDLWNYVRGMS